MENRAGARVILIGAGGHAKVVIEIIRELGTYELVGLIDAKKSSKVVLGLPIIGLDEDLIRIRKQGVSLAFVAIGDNNMRRKQSQKVRAAGFSLINALSPGSVLSPSTKLGVGIATMSGSVVNADCRIGDGCILNTGSLVDHDCRIADYAHVGPGSTLAGNVTIGRLAFLGVGVSVIPGVKIGDNSQIGAGACVIRDISAGAVAWGVPAQEIREVKNVRQSPTGTGRNPRGKAKNTSGRSGT